AGVSTLRTGLQPPQLAVAFGFVVWSVTWFWLWLRALGRNQIGEIVGLIGITVIGVLYTLIDPNPQDTILVFAFIIAGAIFPIRQAVAVMVLLVAFQIALFVFRQLEPFSSINVLINDVLVGLVGVGARFFWQRYGELIAAREQLAQLAVTEERLRFARDVHDLLGQNLSVLVLKSELVAKQLRDDADEPLRNEVRDIAQVARKSLNDLREAVEGYRRPTLQAEITSAHAALRAAGIGLLVEDTVGVLPPEQDGVLAWCLREAVTNVVRHSGARKCEVHLALVDGSANLEVADDGHGATSLNGGSGLVGMRERVALVGGSVKLGAENGGGLHVRVSVPRPA
ncbi:MAG TPA: sensor histidine kinase, partial [Candidatus Dormibacteraeota bacterium]|nr:sensor histidine kinase [Candidatus Dormibacteraeota bacterium]